MNRKHINAVIDHCRREGLTVGPITKSKHIKIPVTAPDGRTHTLTVAATPTCPLSLSNSKAEVRRFALRRGIFADKS
jgi:hypothetical protein